MKHFHCTEHWHLRAAFAALSAEEGRIIPADHSVGGQPCIGMARGEVVVTFPLLSTAMVKDFIGLDSQFVKEHPFLVREKIAEWIRRSGDGACKDRCELCLADLILGS